MAFYTEKIKDIFLLDTPVENIFINEYAASAPGDYIKVYLFARMYAELGEPLTGEDIARQLNIEHEDVLKAWNYWEKTGVIRKHMKGSENSFEYDVEFLVLKDRLYGESGRTEAPAAQNIGSMMSDPLIRDMISGIEQITGKVFNSSEMQEIFSWIEEYQVQPEAIAYAFAYCGKKKKTDVRYVGRVVRDWGSRGLKEIPAIEEYLGGLDRKHTRNRRIFRALGFSRNATEEEARIMDSWFEEMNLTMETVLAACAKTSGINNPNINYVNKVLAGWQQEGRAQHGGGDDSQPAPGEIMRYYETLRTLNEQEADLRREEVYRAVPRIREIDEGIGRLNKDLSRLIISDAVDRKESAEKIREEMNGLNTEKAFLMTENGFEPDYMEIRFACPDCEDTGILKTGEKCQCFTKVTRDRIREISERAKELSSAQRQAGTRF